MNADEAALNAALDADPMDTVTRLVLADWYEEHGRDDDAARERFLVEVGKYPAYMYGTYEPDSPWDWFGNAFDFPGVPHHSMLPHGIFMATAGYARYSTRRSAEADLWRLRDTYTKETS